jgi:hypothetical protein
MPKIILDLVPSSNGVSGYFWTENNPLNLIRIIAAEEPWMKALPFSPPFNSEGA